MRSLFWLLIVAIPALGQSGVPHLIDTKTAQQHLQNPKKMPPIPPIAKAARQFGTCHVQVVVGIEGLVKNTVVLDGPPMLQGAAEEFVSTMSFQPFVVDGQSAVITTVVEVSYGSGSQTPSSTRKPDAPEIVEARRLCYEEQSFKHITTDAGASACKTVADREIQVGDRDVWRSLDYVRASNALLHAKKNQEALDEAAKAVAIADSGHDSDDEARAAYLARAQDYLVMGQLAKGFADLQSAEAFERTAIATIQSDSLKKRYTTNLVELLKLRAKVLQARGDNAGAQSLLDEANKL